jgi:hypothetical protein
MALDGGDNTWEDIALAGFKSALGEKHFSRKLCGETGSGE